MKKARIKTIKTTQAERIAARNKEITRLDGLGYPSNIIAEQLGLAKTTVQAAVSQLRKTSIVQTGDVLANDRFNRVVANYDVIMEGIVTRVQEGDEDLHTLIKLCKEMRECYTEERRSMPRQVNEVESWWTLLTEADNLKPQEHYGRTVSTKDPAHILHYQIRDDGGKPIAIPELELPKIEYNRETCRKSVLRKKTVEIVQAGGSDNLAKKKAMELRAKRIAERTQQRMLRLRGGTPQAGADLKGAEGKNHVTPA